MSSALASLSAESRPPEPRTFHRHVRTAALVLAAWILGAAVMIPVLGAEAGRGTWLRLIIGLILCCNALWWTFADKALLALWPAPSRLRKGTRAALLIGWAGMVAPIAATFVQGRAWPLARVAPWMAGGFQLWHMLLAAAMPICALAAYAFLGGRGLIRRFASGALGRAAAGAETTAESACQPCKQATLDARGPTRRDFLRAAAVYSPVLATTGLVLGGRRGIRSFEVNRRRLAAPWLPTRLRGLTLTHVSDLHVGRLFPPSMLAPVVEQVNRLDSDLLVVTGDIVDMSNDMLPPAIEALRQMRHRHGLFLCIGNHDLIDDGEDFMETLRGSGLDLLRDERRVVRIGGEVITIAGLDWAGHDRRDRRMDVHAPHVEQMLRGHDPSIDGPCIALAHHPHAFDALAARGTPLTLSGHTHGGQIMAVPPRADGIGSEEADAGAGRMLFRYLRGFYRLGDSTLFVNRGVGNWLPVRVNAPAEIAQLQLT